MSVCDVSDEQEICAVSVIEGQQIDVIGDFGRSIFVMHVIRKDAMGDEPVHVM